MPLERTPKQQKKEFPPKLSKKDTQELVLALMRRGEGKNKMNLMQRAEEAYKEARADVRAASKLSREQKKMLVARAEYLNKVLKTLEELAEGKVPRTMKALDYLGEGIFGSAHRRSERFYDGPIVTKEGIEKMMSVLERAIYGATFIDARKNQHAIFHEEVGEDVETEETEETGEAEKVEEHAPEEPIIEPAAPLEGEEEPIADEEVEEEQISEEDEELDEEALLERKARLMEIGEESEEIANILSNPDTTLSPEQAKELVDDVCERYLAEYEDYPERAEAEQKIRMYKEIVSAKYREALEARAIRYGEALEARMMRYGNATGFDEIQKEDKKRGARKISFWGAALAALAAAGAYMGMKQSEGTVIEDAVKGEKFTVSATLDEVLPPEGEAYIPDELSKPDEGRPGFEPPNAP